MLLNLEFQLNAQIDDLKRIIDDMPPWESMDGNTVPEYTYNDFGHPENLYVYFTDVHLFESCGGFKALRNPKGCWLTVWGYDQQAVSMWGMLREQIEGEYFELTQY